MIYTPIPRKLGRTLRERQEDLFWKLASLEGSIYSLGAAVAELRKEYMHLRKEVNERQR